MSPQKITLMIYIIWHLRIKYGKNHPPIQFQGILAWVGQLVLARFIGIINLNIWQIIIIGPNGVCAQTVREDPHQRERNYETAHFWQKDWLLFASSHREQCYRLSTETQQPKQTFKTGVSDGYLRCNRWFAWLLPWVDRSVGQRSLLCSLNPVDSRARTW